MQEKIQKVLDYLPANRELFEAYAQFEDVRQVHPSIAGSYFQKNLQSIARKFTISQYTEKSLSDIDEDDVMMDFMGWLESGKIKFLRTTQNIKQNAQAQNRVKTILVEKQQIPQKNIQPEKPEVLKPELNSPVGNQARIKPVSHAFQNNQQRPAKPHASQIVHRVPETSNRSLEKKQTHPSLEREVKKKNPQTQKRTVLENLSKCLEFPEKRFYIMPEMLTIYKKYRKE